MPEKILCKLPDPQPMPMTVTDALRKRRTLRSISGRPLTEAELSNLLWAAAGVTSKDGKRTAPTCLNLRSVSVFLLAKDGVWRYDGEKHALELVVREDLRAASTLGQHAFVDNAPATLVFVAENTPRTQMALPYFVYLDAGAMMENAAIAAAAQGLAGVPRGSVNGPELGKSMRLPATFTPIFCYTVGHPQ
ncbi:SagB/ThcOx family dehydrogenase [Sutterella faecalis]|uniref:SagB/ThcOx family dehydrogenase n=3 Tax=Sutterella TaxID=40544 RepID=A0AAI9SDU0_9BURK|nr:MULTISPECIES: nitroreductase family protein [Sutterella]KAB7651808.1 SagB/ThcOx family dehydrogenase [Sutterella seckii]QDA54082.1 SagB/ThcOx family dehydrogenase [Sutterella faecalis]